jgi:hypothetical protein
MERDRKTEVCGLSVVAVVITFAGELWALSKDGAASSKPSGVVDTASGTLRERCEDAGRALETSESVDEYEDGNCEFPSFTSLRP